MDPVAYRGWDSIEVSFLVLDFMKERETRLCLESLKRHVKFPAKVYLLSQSGGDYAWRLYREGLADYLLLPRRNTGTGIGTQELFRLADTEFCVYVQNDQVLVRDFTPELVHSMARCLYFPGRSEELSWRAIGLAGDPNGGKYSERAHLVRTSEYLSIPGKPIGGPGPMDRTHIWTEEHVSNHFKNSGWKFGIWLDPLFADIGKYSVRELPDGGILKHRTDTGELEVVVRPKGEHPGYDFSPEEWADMASGKWQAGRIPEKWKAGSRNFWDAHPVAKHL